MNKKDVLKKVDEGWGFAEKMFSLEAFLVGVSFVFSKPNHLSLTAGAIVSSLGLMIYIWTLGFPRPRIQDPKNFTLSGPREYVRHPFLLARFLMLFGLIFMSRNHYCFMVSAAILGWHYHRILTRDTLIQKALLGPSYAVYRYFVPTFLPVFFKPKMSLMLSKGLFQSIWRGSLFVKQSDIPQIIGWILPLLTIWILTMTDTLAMSAFSWLGGLLMLRGAAPLIQSYLQAGRSRWSAKHRHRSLS